MRYHCAGLDYKLIPQRICACNHFAEMITELNSPRIKPLYVISKVEWYLRCGHRASLKTIFRQLAIMQDQAGNGMDSSRSHVDLLTVTRKESQRTTLVGGNFGPEKNDLAPLPPTFPEETPPPPPFSSLLGDPPPLLRFSITKADLPPFLAPQTSPWPPPNCTDMKPIQNVHQDLLRTKHAEEQKKYWSPRKQKIIVKNGWAQKK